MADWGVLQGLGDAMQSFGGAMSKQALDEKLRKAREAREDELEQRRNERQDAQYARTEMVEGGDGSVWEVDYDKQNREITRRPAAPNKVREIKQSQQKENLTLESLLLEIEDRKRESRWEEEDRPLEREKMRAEIEAQRALAGQRSLSGQAAMVRAQRTGLGGGGGRSGSLAAAATGPSLGEAIPSLIKEYDPLVKEYTSGDDPVLSMEQVYELARAAIQASAERPDRKDPADTFRILLQREAAKRKQAAPAADTPATRGSRY